MTGRRSSPRGPRRCNLAPMAATSPIVATASRIGAFRAPRPIPAPKASIAVAVERPRSDQPRVGSLLYRSQARAGSPRTASPIILIPTPARTAKAIQFAAVER